MPTFTTRLGLTKPAGGEARAVGPINTNSDLFDKFMPCILVNDGVTPPTGDLYDGALVKERTSGIIWEARKNGGGTFDKYYVSYPFHFVGDSQVAAFPTGTSGQAVGFANITTAQCINAGSGNVSGGFLVIPVTGIYTLTAYSRWDINATGQRSLRFHVNGAADFSTTPELTVDAAAGGIPTNLAVATTRYLTKNDQIAANCWQNSGGNLLLGVSRMFVHLDRPVGAA